MKKKHIRTSVIIIPLIILCLVFAGKVKAEPYGWSPDVDNSWKGPPSCNDPKPEKAPVLFQPNSSAFPQPTGRGEVRLQWLKVDGASGYNIYYGLSSKNYIFSVPDLPGEAQTITIGGLGSRKFYFAVQVKKGCAASDLSNEWSAWPKGGYSASTYGSYTPVTRTGGTTTTDGEDTDTSYVVPTVAPTDEPQVQGVSTEVQPSYEIPVNPASNPPPQTTPTPKPKGFFQKILSVFFGK